MRSILTGCVFAVAMTGAALADSRDLSGFTQVNASDGVNVSVAAGSGFGVRVTGPGADRVVVRVAGDTLIIERPGGFRWGSSPRADVHVTMPRVDGLSASSGADLVATNIAAEHISLNASSGADLRVSGRCGRFTAGASSGSDLHAEALRCDLGDVDVSSGADARVFASERLNVDASSGGGVLVYGGGGIGSVELSSGGSMRRAQ